LLDTKSTLWDCSQGCQQLAPTHTTARAPLAPQRPDRHCHVPAHMLDPLQGLALQLPGDGLQVVTHKMAYVGDRGGACRAADDNKACCGIAVKAASCWHSHTPPHGPFLLVHTPDTHFHVLCTC
jgi:hypothetical protein